MIYEKQLRDLIIKPALYDLILDSPQAEELLVFTCAVESFGGTYLKQISGPALGIYQMEPTTYYDIWQNYLRGQPEINAKMVMNFDCNFLPPQERLIYDLRFATAMARIHYRRVPEPLPNQNNLDAIWEYYKKYYNTLKGKAEKSEAIAIYKNYTNR